MSAPSPSSESFHFVHLAEYAKSAFDSIRSHLNNALLIVDSGADSIIAQTIGAAQLHDEYHVHAVYSLDDPLINDAMFTRHITHDDNGDIASVTSVPSEKSQDATEDTDADGGGWDVDIDLDESTTAHHTRRDNDGAAALAFIISQPLTRSIVARIERSALAFSERCSSVTILVNEFSAVALRFGNESHSAIERRLQTALHLPVSIQQFALAYAIVLPSTIYLPAPPPLIRPTYNGNDDAMTLSGQRALIVALSALIHHLKLSVDIFSIGQQCSPLVEHLVAILNGTTQHLQWQRASLILIDRTLDLHSLFAYDQHTLLWTTRQPFTAARETAVMIPSTEQAPLYSFALFLAADTTPAFTPSPLARLLHPNNRDSSMLLSTLITESTEISFKIARKKLISALNTENISIDNKRINNVTPTDILFVLKHFIDNPRVMFRYYELIELINYWMESLSSERIDDITAKIDASQRTLSITLENNDDDEDDSAQSVLLQLVDLLQIKNMPSMHLPLSALLSLILYAYSIIGSRGLPRVEEDALRSALIRYLTEKYTTSPEELSGLFGADQSADDAADVVDSIMDRVAAVRQAQSALTDESLSTRTSSARSLIVRIVSRLLDRRLPPCPDVRHTPLKRPSASQQIESRTLRKGLAALSSLVSAVSGTGGSGSHKSSSPSVNPTPFMHPTVIVAITGAVSWQEIAALNHISTEHSDLQIIFVAANGIDQSHKYTLHLHINQPSQSSATSQLMN